MFQLTLRGEVKTYYEHERDNVNRELRAAVATDVSAVVAAAQRLRLDAFGLCSSVTDLRTQTLVDFDREFRWPSLAVPTLAELSSLLSFVSKAEVVSIAPSWLKFAETNPAKPLFEGMRKELLKREVDSNLSKLDEIAVPFSSPEALRRVCTRLYEIVHSKNFVFAKHEINQLEKLLDPLLEDLVSNRQAQADAVRVENLRDAEQLAQQELDIFEKCLELSRKLVAAAATTTSDANEFFEILESIEAETETLQQEMRSTNDAIRTAAIHDAQSVQQRIIEETSRIEAVRKAAASKISELDDREKMCVAKRGSIWETIRNLLAEDEEIVQQWSDVVGERADHVMALHKQNAEFNALAQGLANTVKGLEAAIELSKQGDEFISQFCHHCDAMVAAADAKCVDEEAADLRRKQQLRYLQSFTDYWLASATLCHRKDTRIVAAARLIRNLELQVREATQVLDSKKSDYERELAQLCSTQETIRVEVNSLLERQRKEKDLFYPVQQQLEEDDVAFDPPEVVVNKKVLALKSETIDIARRFVVEEQDNVDKDTIQLRKLRVASQVQIEQLQQRRQDRTIEA